jgi:hypothetical protein
MEKQQKDTEYPEWCGEDANCSECPYEYSDGNGCELTDGPEALPYEKRMTLGIDVDGLREELSRGCEYAATQEVVHSNFLEAMQELGGVGDWDEMAAEDLEGQMCILQSLFESFYDKTVEKILNYIESYKEEEE